MWRHRTVGEQHPAFLQNDRIDIARRRCLVSFFVDFPLRNDRRRLIGRQSIDREKPRRMPRQPVERQHADPAVHSSRQPFADRSNSHARTARMRASVRGWKNTVSSSVSSISCVPIALNRFATACSDTGSSRGLVNISDNGLISLPTGRHPINAACTNVVPRPAKRIVNGVARPCQTFDEEPGKLRLETGAVADFMQLMPLTLAGGPVFVDEVTNAGLLPSPAWANR